jgi:DNA-binding response OmpR family regulator
MMPEMDGYELCSAVKNDDTLNHIPVILLTAKASDEAKYEGLRTGADDYIVKPFKGTDLVLRAENLIEVRRALRRRFSRVSRRRRDDGGGCPEGLARGRPRAESEGAAADRI